MEEILCLPAAEGEVLDHVRETVVVDNDHTALHRLRHALCLAPTQDCEQDEQDKCDKYDECDECGECDEC